MRTKARRGRRIKILRLPMDVIIDIFNGKDLIDLKRCLPDSAIAETVHTNWELGAVELMISDPSFAIVPAGEVPPIIDLLI